MTASSSEAAPSPHGGPAPRWVLLAQEAATRGFRNVLAFRRWCRRRGVPIRLDGRKQWVSPVDVDSAIATIPPETTPCGDAATCDVDPVALAVEALILTRRTR